MNIGLQRYRGFKNALAMSLAVLAAALGLAVLGWILWTTLSRGLSAFSLALFTEATPPPEMPGGLSKCLSPGEIASLLSLEQGADAEQLVMAAIDARAIDNVTAITIEFGDSDPATTVEIHKSRGPATPTAAPANGASGPVTR